MIREITPADKSAILELVIEAGLFPRDDVDPLASVIDDCVCNRLGLDHLWVVDDLNGVRAVAYFGPERMTDGTWNLFMIAVSPVLQKQGLGSEMLSYAEKNAASRGAHQMLIETSNLQAFENSRAFYAKNGYKEEARIRDFYKLGEDKIVFRKLLTKT